MSECSVDSHGHCHGHLWRRCKVGSLLSLPSISRVGEQIGLSAGRTVTLARWDCAFRKSTAGSLLKLMILIGEDVMLSTPEQSRAGKPSFPSLHVESGEISSSRTASRSFQHCLIAMGDPQPPDLLNAFWGPAEPAGLPCAGWDRPAAWTISLLINGAVYFCFMTRLSLLHFRFQGTKNIK